MGYRIDPPDGMPDARTEAALAAFLHRHALPPATPVSGLLVAVAKAAAELQRAERLVRAGLRRDDEERLVRADLARRAPAALVAAETAQ